MCRFLHVSRKALGAKAQLAQAAITSSLFRMKNGMMNGIQMPMGPSAMGTKFNGVGFGSGLEFTQAEALGNSQLCAYFASPRGCTKRDRCDFVHSNVTPGFGMHPPYPPVIIIHPATGSMVRVVPVIGPGGLPMVPLGPNGVPVTPMMPVPPGILPPGCL